MAQDTVMGIPPGNFVYERRSSTISEPVPALTSGYRLLYFQKPSHRERFLLYGVGTDQHTESDYTWVVDDVTLPISGAARVGTPGKAICFSGTNSCFRVYSIIYHKQQRCGIPESSGRRSGCRVPIRVPYLWEICVRV